MLTLSEMKTAVADRIQKDDSSYLTKIEKWINYRYADILGRADWPQLYKTTTITSTADSETLTLNRDIEYIVNIHDRVNDIVLTPSDPSQGGRLYADTQDSSGTPRTYWWEGTSVAGQPASASTLSVVSASASDTSQTVRIWGIDNNSREINEQVTLTGTSAATTTATFSRVDRVSKSATTVGAVTVTAGAVTVATIDMNSRTSRNIVIHLVKRPSSAIVYTITYKIRTPKLEYDEDVPMLGCSHALVIGAYCDALRQQRQHSKAKLLEYNPQKEHDPSTYEGRVLQLVQKFEQNAENIPRALPQIQISDIDDVETYYKS